MLPVVCLFAISYNHVSLCMITDLFTCPDGQNSRSIVARSK